jgi:anti-sigma factor RsiW
MTHVRERIQACLDGELTPTEAEVVRKHCASCPECGRAWRETAALWDAVDRVPPPLLSRSLWPELQARRNARTPSWPRLGFATGALAVTAAGLWLGLWFGAELTDDLNRVHCSSKVWT